MAADPAAAELHGERLADLLAGARGRLAEAGIEDADLDARLIVEHVTGAGRLEALVSPDRPVAPAVVRRLAEALERRAAGMPVHRILGMREFYGLPLHLSAATLEPRPDTETLVDMVLPFARERAEGGGGCAVLDLGTGTGAIALAILANVGAATATATDISAEALATAADNAARLGLGGRLSALRSDWFASVSGRFHLIVSNPPYIRSEDIATLQREVREHDPLAALDGGADGLEAYRRIAGGAGEHLAEGGRIAVEIGFGQADDVTRIFAGNGFAPASAARDLAGRERALAFRR